MSEYQGLTQWAVCTRGGDWSYSGAIMQKGVIVKLGQPNDRRLLDLGFLRRGR